MVNSKKAPITNTTLKWVQHQISFLIKPNFELSPHKLMGLFFNFQSWFKILAETDLI